MKTFVITCFLLLNFYINGLCQSKAMIRGGANHSTLYNSSKDKLEPFTTHVNFGFGIEWKLRNKMTLLTESLFSVKGHNDFTDGTRIPELPKHLHLNYLSFPFSINHQLGKSVKVKAGGEINYLTFKKVAFIDENFNSATRKIDFGLLCGLRYSLLKDIELGVAYYYGLSAAIKFSEDEQFKNRNFQIYVGYIFD